MRAYLMSTNVGEPIIALRVDGESMRQIKLILSVFPQNFSGFRVQNRQRCVRNGAELRVQAIIFCESA